MKRMEYARELRRLLLIVLLAIIHDIDLSKFSRRARKETENSGKHDFKTSDYNSKFSDSNAKDSEFSVNIKNTSSEKFQKKGGSVQNNMENKEWLLKNIPGSILLYRQVFLKCHFLGQNTVVLRYFWSKT